MDKTTKAIFLIVIVALAGSVGYLTLVKRQTAPTQQIVSPTTTSKTANWEKFSTKYFSFRYPPDWSITLDIQLRNPKLTEVYNTSDDPIVVSWNIAVYILDNPSFLPIVSFLRSYENGRFLKYAEVASTTVAGQEALSLRDNKNSSPYDPYLATFIADGERIISVVSDKESEEQFKDILSTFNFTE